ncbi:hypothetical protein [Bradyrhizobium nanningense]|uniref:hypothetical protein n=1 Tax=Bradyrhizobium nanningense TaxID=1325118 RepID=UPI001008F270
MVAVRETVEPVKPVEVDQYDCGFETLIDSALKGLSEELVKSISQKKNEPASMLQWRLEAYCRGLTMQEPTRVRADYPKIDFQELYFYAAPKPKKTVTKFDEMDSDILKTYKMLGICLREVAMLRKASSGSPGEENPAGRKVARDPVFDWVPVATTLKKSGVIADLGKPSASIPSRGI